MARFLDLWFFDWLTVTIPNPTTGKGQRPEAGGKSDEMEREAILRLARWARSHDLHQIRIGNGSDGFRAGLHLGWTPADKERVATIRAGHSTNMPSLELPGADGACDDLARSALARLGPVLVARADVSLDLSRPGLWDALHRYAVHQTGAGGGRGMKPPRVIHSDLGRTFYWGGDAVSLKVYEKDLERVARGKLAPADADQNLVRIEFTFRPETRKKAAFARLSPGEMIGTSVWARRFVEHLARITGAAEATDEMGKVRVAELADASTVEDRARHVIGQAVKTCIAAAAFGVVRDEFGGKWGAAMMRPSVLIRRATEMIERQITEMGVADQFVETAGLDKLRTREERAALMADQPDSYLIRLTDNTREAQEHLAATVSEAAAMTLAERQALEAANAALRHENAAMEDYLDAMYAAA